ncbi:MAG: hypothetical protein ACI8WB_003074 [Phenylobacterium sp.]|jgi:hypothetical protein
MIIKPGVGIGTIKFGIKESTLITQLGEPDFVDEDEYVEDSGRWYRELCYYYQNISFSFDKEDGYKLGGISVVGSGHLLFNKALFGLPKKYVKNFVAKMSSEIPKEEDWTSDAENSLEYLEYDGLGMSFWFESGNLSKIEYSYLFEPDEETVIWPE